MPRNCKQASDEAAFFCFVMIYFNQRNIMNPSKPTGATLLVLLELYN